MTRLPSSLRRCAQLVGVAMMLGGSGTAFGAAVPLSRDRPNIAFIMADNLGWGELGVYGGGALRGAPTPRIDALAAEGMRLQTWRSPLRRPGRRG